jgi:hypothetical protein
MPRIDSEHQDAGFAKLYSPRPDQGDPADGPTTWEAAWIDLGGEG